MSAALVIIIVMLMLNVPTLRGASPAPVTKDTVGMELAVMVSIFIQEVLVYLCTILYQQWFYIILNAPD